MTTKYIDVDDGKWGIIVIFDFNEDDNNDMAAIMRSFGMREKNVKRALRILSCYDTGMTVSQDDLRMSALFIGKASSRSQWWNTLNHELLHVGTAIIDYYGEEYDGEPAAYLQGYLMQKVVEEIAVPCR